MGNGHDDTFAAIAVWLGIAGVAASLAAGCAFGAAWGWLCFFCVCLANIALLVAKAARHD